jgi:hypothetical protein
VSNGYADVNGIKLYHEIYGQGEPMVLIHGGLTTNREHSGIGLRRIGRGSPESGSRRVEGRWV